MAGAKSRLCLPASAGHAGGHFHPSVGAPQGAAVTSWKESLAPKFMTSSRIAAPCCGIPPPPSIYVTVPVTVKRVYCCPGVYAPLAGAGLATAASYRQAARRAWMRCVCMVWVSSRRMPGNYPTCILRRAVRRTLLAERSSAVRRTFPYTLPVTAASPAPASAACPPA